MKSPRRVNALTIVLICLTFVATVVVLAPLQRALHENMQELHRRIIAELETRINRSISYDRISPSILSFIEIHDLRVHGRSGERAELLRIGRVRAHFRIRDLLGLGDPDAPVIQRIVLDNSQLELDLERDQDLIQFVQELARSANGGTSALHGLRLDARNIALRLRNQQQLVSANELAFSLRFGTAKLEFRVATLLEYNERTNQALRANIESEGAVKFDLSSADISLAINELVTPAVTVRGYQFGVLLQDQRLEVRNLPDQEPIDIKLAIDIPQQSVELRFQAQDYNPQRTVILGDELLAQAPWLIETLSGRGELQAHLGTGVELSELPGLGRHFGDHILDQLGFSYSLQLNTVLSASDSPENLFIQLQATGDEYLVRVQDMRFSSTYSSGEAGFRGVVDIPKRAPDGVLNLQGFSYRDSKPLTGVIGVHRAEEDRWMVSSDRVRYGDGVVHQLSLGLTPQPDAVEIEGLFYLEELGTELVAVDGTVLLQDVVGFAGNVELRNVRASSVYELVRGVGAAPGITDPAPLQLESLRIDTRVSLRSTSGALSELQAPYVSVFDTENVDRYLSFSIFGEDNTYEIEDIFFGYNNRIVQGSAYAELNEGGIVEFTSRILFENELYELAGGYDPRFGLEIQTQRGLYLMVWQSVSGVLSFAAEADELVLPLLPQEASLGFNLSGEFRSLLDWEVLIHHLRYAGVPSLTATRSSVVLGGSLGPEGGTLSEVRLEDSVASLVGTASVSYGFSSPFRIETSIELFGEPAGEQYRLDLTLYDGELSGDLRYTRASLRRLGRPNIRGVVDGHAVVKGSPASPHLVGELEVREGRYNNDPFTAVAGYDLSPGRLELRDLELRYLNSLFQADQAVIDREAGTARLHGTFRHESRRGTTELTVGLNGLYSESESGLISPFSDDFRAAVRLRSAEVFHDQADNEFELRFVRNGNLIILDAGLEGELSGRITIDDGAFELRARAPFPVSMQTEGILESGRIEANLNRIELQAGRVAHLLDFVEFAVLDAYITGSLRIVGPINNPEFFGTLLAESVRSRLTFTPEPITARRIYLVFQENTILMNRTHARTGNGGGFATGMVVLNRWSPDEFRIDVETEDERGVRVSHDFDTVVVDGYGIGSLSVFGTRELVNIHGDFTARSTTITLSDNFDTPRRRTVGNTEYLLDITARSGRGVEFYWPTINFPLLRSFARSGEQLRVRWDSVNSTFSLVGAVGIQGGELFYFDRSFYIREGRIVFNESEESFDPLLSARAEVREISDRGPVTIFMVVDNSRFSEFTPRFESNPLLPENEIAELLGGQVFGQTVGDFAALSSAVLLPGEVGAQLGVMRRFETRLRDTLRLDLLSVRTPVFQNLVRGALEDRTEDIESQVPSLGGYLNNTSIFLGKYIGADVFLELLLRMQAVNQFDPNTRDIGGLAVDTELTLEFQTPFFLLEWGFFPRDLNELYVRDNTFSFFWEFSY